jgi:hypothetical protein
VRERFWRTVILSAAIPKFTITCFILQCALRTRHNAEYETPVLDEIDDLFSEKDQSVAIVLKSKSLTLRTPKGRKERARFVDQKQC